MKIGHESRIMVEALHDRLLKSENESRLYKVREIGPCFTKYSFCSKCSKQTIDSTQESHKKKVNVLQLRLAKAIKEKEAIEERRAFEVEGLTNDIISLRKKLAISEDHLLKLGPLADAELALLNACKCLQVFHGM
jgi:hypothetical protein